MDGDLMFLAIMATLTTFVWCADKLQSGKKEQREESLGEKFRSLLRVPWV